MYYMYYYNLQENSSSFDSRLLELQLELEQKYSVEKAQLSTQGVSVAKQHEQELRNVEERYSFEIADLKRVLNSSRSELQEAKDRLLGEEDKFSKLEKHLLALQDSHRVEVDAIRSQHQQEIVEHTSKGTGLESLQQQHEVEKQELVGRLQILEDEREKLSGQKSNITR